MALQSVYDLWLGAPNFQLPLSEHMFQFWKMVSLVLVGSTLHVALLRIESGCLVHEVSGYRLWSGMSMSLMSKVSSDLVFGGLVLQLASRIEV